jgi:hypothetical protein
LIVDFLRGFFSLRKGCLERSIDTLRSPPPWDVADFQRLLGWLRVDGFYLFEEHVKDPTKLPARWGTLRPQ